MDARSFIIGVACGALIGVAAGWLLADSDEKEVFTKTQPAPSVPSDSASDMKPIESTAQNSSKGQVTVDGSRTPEVPPAYENRVEGAVPWPADQWEKFELEEKDSSWAYYMEQTLLQFLGSHPSAAQFSISRIECRTTKCQLQVVGYDESTLPVWQQVMYDIRQQPWSEFGQYGTSSGAVDGSFILIGTLWRQPEQE
jgi:hypothetical protein